MALQEGPCRIPFKEVPLRMEEVVEGFLSITFCIGCAHRFAHRGPDQLRYSTHSPNSGRGNRQGRPFNLWEAVYPSGPR